MMKFLLVLLVTFVVGDGILTRVLLDKGIAREGNPFLQPLVGGDFFLILKVAGALICALILWDIYRRFPRVAMAATWCFVIAYWGIVLWNFSIFIRG